MEQWIRDLMSPGGALIIFNVGFFIAWYYTFKRSNQVQDQTRQEIVNLFNLSDKRYAETTSTIIQLLKDDQEYKALVAGVMDRLSVKLEHPIVCPFTMTDKAREATNG